MSELKCSICGCSENDTPKFYKHTKYGDNLCNKHYIQLKRYGEIRDGIKKEGNKDKVCIICGDNYNIKHCHIDDVDGYYKGKPLCQYHYGQLVKYKAINNTNISPSRIKRECCVCGSTESDCRIIYYKKDGKMYCLKHYSQIKKLGGLKEKTVFEPNEYNIRETSNGVIVEIFLTNRYFDVVEKTIVDYDDFKKYFYNKKISLTNRYAYLGNKQIQKIIMKTDELIDHINMDTLDNRKCNLRVADKSKNSINCGIRSNNKSGYTGVCWDRKFCKWRAYCNVDGKRIELGYYEDKKVAIEVRLKAELKYFKSFRNNCNEEKYKKEYGINEWRKLLESGEYFEQ